MASVEVITGFEASGVLAPLLEYPNVITHLMSEKLGSALSKGDPVFFDLFFSVFMRVWVCAWSFIGMEVRGKVVGVSSPLPPCGSWG